ncbi:MAG: hypothetical protein AAF720_15775, partial [Pseudomonadota bacterium]
KASDLSIETRLFIDGEYKDAQSQDRFETLNPANGDVIASVVSGDASVWTSDVSRIHKFACDMEVGSFG